jgi:hypothetical protein
LSAVNPKIRGASFEPSLSVVSLDIETSITNGTIQWPMAVGLWKVGHPDLDAVVADWRASAQTGHLPNIEWDKHAPGTVAARKWKGDMPKPGEINPINMPEGGKWPVSQGIGWGSAKIAKVVKCSDIPKKLFYNKELFYCDHMPNSTSAVSSVDEAYAVWRSLTGVWPPTKPCQDDQKALDGVLKQIAPTLEGANCSAAFATLQQYLPGFGCDNTDTPPSIRDMCWSICGGKPIPDVPSPPPPPSPTALQPHCTVCNHMYDAEKDGSGEQIRDLPDS